MPRRFALIVSLFVLLLAVWLFRGRGDEPAESRRADKPRVASVERHKELPPARDLGAAAPPAASAPERLKRPPGAKHLDAVVPMRPRDDSAGAPADPGPDDVEQMIRTATEDPDPTERAAAIGNLSLLDDVNVIVPVLRQASSDTDADVKLAIVTALSELGEDVPMDLLTQFANDPDPDIRLEVLGVVESLSEEETTAPRVAPLLRNALRDPNEDVRDKAQDIVESMTDDSDSGSE